MRGTEGKIQAINWARKQKKPFLGNKLCSESCRFSASAKYDVITVMLRLNLKSTLFCRCLFGHAAGSV